MVTDHIIDSLAHAIGLVADLSDAMVCFWSREEKAVDKVVCLQCTTLICISRCTGDTSMSENCVSEAGMCSKIAYL